MAVLQQTKDQTEPTEEPVSTKTRIVLDAIDRLDRKITDLQDVSEAVTEIQRILGTVARDRNSWRNAIIRALNQFLSHVDPNWKKNHQ